MSAIVTLIPNRGNSSVIRPYVPPYTSALATTWSPFERSPSMTVEIAAIPLAKSSPSSAPSRAQIFSTHASELTLERRE